MHFKPSNFIMGPNPLLLRCVEVKSIVPPAT